MENLFEELGIPSKYLKKSAKNDRYLALVHNQWLKSLFKHSKLTDFIEKSRSEVWPIVEDSGSSWTKIYISVFKKRDAKVIPLPRIRPSVSKEDNPLLFPQLMQYISQTNYKNLWKDAYKKYSLSSEFSKETQVTLVDYNDVLREIILRIYGCCIVNTLDSTFNMDSPKDFDVHMNVLPIFCGVETLNAIFLLHIPYIEHNLNDCVTFSPAILDRCHSKPMFIVYQLVQLLKSLHDRSLTLGDVSLNDIYLTEDLWIYVFPQISSNIYVQDLTKIEIKSTAIKDCRKTGHKFDSNILKCLNCGLRTYDKVQCTSESLEELCKFWIEGKISNFTYILCLNKFSGRKLGDPNCHYVFPWVTDFASRCGKNWRDLKKSKFRLNKGDRQLDLTYDHSQTQVPHHVSDVLSSITYYVYMARRTSKSVLCKNVRTIWVPAEYPSSIQRMQEWTPDECIPEFFTDPSVFRSIHDDLDDLEVPTWASGPEDFVERHREALESEHVSERLHYWIDLTFGYKLSGNAAIKAKNVCLQLADDHTNLTKSGIVQLFSHPHPIKATSSPFWAKVPPKILVNTPPKQSQRSRDRSSSSHAAPDINKSDEDDILDGNISGGSNWSPLGLSKILSRSRSSLHEEQGPKPNRSPSAQRSASLGPKNPTFTSHVTQKSKSNQLSVQSSTLNTGIIYLPKEYKPEQPLENLEKRYGFASRTFHTESGKTFKIVDEEQKPADKNSDECLVQNAFTNFIYSEKFEETFKVKPKATKSYTFPMDNFNMEVPGYNRGQGAARKMDSQIVCNYSDIISSRRVRELQILGCLIVEIFLARQLRALGSNNMGLSFTDRLKSGLTLIKSCKNDVPSCISYIVTLLLQPQISDLKNFSHPVVTNLGLPPPSAHLLLEPLLHSVVPFPKPFPMLYRIITHLKEFKNVALELNILYHFDCDGTKCAEYESLERTKILFAKNIAECKVKSCARHLEEFFESINVNTDAESVNILLPHIKELIEDPPTSVLAAWYLFDPVSRVLGPKKSVETLLESILKLYENEPTENYLPYNEKIARLYHHSFLLRLIVRLGLKCFLENFVTPLVEAVGGYKDYDKADFILHTHSEKVLRKTSHLKNMDAENTELCMSDESSPSSDRPAKLAKTGPLAVQKEEEMFELDEEKENEEQMKSLIEHLELNIASDLPFNHSTAEEALDATLTENIDQLRNLEELNLNLSDIEAPESRSGVTSPTIPIPSSYHGNVMNISCEIGSKKSETDSFLEKKSLSSQIDLYLDSPSSGNDQSKLISSSTGSFSRLTSKSRKIDTKISETSSDTIIWLSHRLGPVLMARYLSRNLLKMLTLCYVGKDNLLFLGPHDTEEDAKNNISVASSRVVGDENAGKVMECLASIAALYGEKLILFQFLPHMSELLTLCKRKLTQTLEGGLISCLALLKHIIPYLSDATLMDQLQDILSGVIHPTVRLLVSTKYVFPSGFVARNVLARKYVDTLYVLSIRIGSDMTRKYLAVPALQRFFLIFDKVHGNGERKFVDDKCSSEKDSLFFKPSVESHFIPQNSMDWTMGGRPIPVPHVRLKDSESLDSLSPTQVTSLGEENIQTLAMEELREVFTPELAHMAYLPFLKHVGVNSLDISLKNHDRIRELCQDYEQEIKSGPLEAFSKMKLSDFSSGRSVPPSSSIGSNINVIGNRIDIQAETSDPSHTTDLLSLVSNRMENTSRHLKGNWFSYWAHEIGRPDKDTSFNFNQIKLQTFVGHTNSVKSLYILDNENSFMSGSRDKTVKLWSLRSQGDGTSTSNCQWTYTGHKKSILSLTFVESMRLVASCDSVVHLWDPFMGAIVGQLESPRFSPVNVVRSMPSPSSLVFSATTEGTIKIIDTRLANYVYDLKITVNPSGLIRCLAIGPSGHWVAAGQSSGCITVLDTRTGLVISSWRAHEGEVLQIVALNEEVLVSSSLDQTISVWNVNDGRFKHHMRGPTEPAHCLCVYDNTELVSGTTANRVGVHTEVSAEASYSSTKLRSDTFKGLLTSMGMLPLNRLLLLGADNGQISLLC